jgi:hypothetical protein
VASGKAYKILDASLDGFSFTVSTIPSHPFDNSKKYHQKQYDDSADPEHWPLLWDFERSERIIFQ